MLKRLEKCKEIIVYFLWHEMRILGDGIQLGIHLLMSFDGRKKSFTLIDFTLTVQLCMILQLSIVVSIFKIK